MTDTATQEAPLDPVNLPAYVTTWRSNAQPDRDLPGAVTAAELLARTVDHLNVAHTDAQERLVPHADDRIRILLEHAGLTPAAVVKVAEQISKELRVLTAEIHGAAKQTLHRRMAVDLATNLVPTLNERNDRE